MIHQEGFPNTRRKVALWGTILGLTVAGIGCGENDEKQSAASQTTPPAVKVPSNADLPLQCADESYVAKQGELIRIKLDDDYRISVVNAGIAYGAHLIAATLYDRQTEQNVDSQMADNLKDINFVRHLPATGETETVYRVETEAIPGNTQEVSISLCSRSPSDMDATWQHVKDDAFSIIQPPTGPTTNQPPANNSQI